jgi:hypothetical protein
MDDLHLEAFTAVGDELSFRRAADRLHLSGSPVSRHVRELEAELGAPLFERDARRGALAQDRLRQRQGGADAQHRPADHQQRYPWRHGRQQFAEHARRQASRDRPAHPEAVPEPGQPRHA